MDQEAQREMRWDSQQSEKESSSTVLLYRAFCLLMSNLRARISLQWDIRDCNILCLSETWLTTSGADTAVTLSSDFSDLRKDRTAEASKTKDGELCFIINKKWCDPRNISTLKCSCLPHLEHLSIICCPFYLPQEFSSIIVTAVYIPPQANTGLALSKLPDVLTGNFNKANLRQVILSN